MKAIKLITTSLLPVILLGCASTSTPPINQLLQQEPLVASELENIFIGKVFNTQVKRGRFGGFYKVAIKRDNKISIDDGRHYRNWRLEGNKVCIESCFNLYASEQTPNVYYAITDGRIDLILKPYR
jgi:hypothetical protein